MLSSHDSETHIRQWKAKNKGIAKSVASNGVIVTTATTNSTTAKSVGSESGSGAAGSRPKTASVATAVVTFNFQPQNEVSSPVIFTLTPRLLLIILTLTPG